MSQVCSAFFKTVISSRANALIARKGIDRHLARHAVGNHALDGAAVTQHRIDRLRDERAVLHAQFGVLLEEALQLDIGRGVEREDDR